MKKTFIIMALLLAASIGYAIGVQTALRDNTKYIEGIVDGKEIGYQEGHRAGYIEAQLDAMYEYRPGGYYGDWYWGK